MEYKGFTYTPASKTAWDNLSMLEKSEMMKVAVKNGITDLKTIREKYNEFAKGGYLDQKEKASKYKHLDIDNDRTYDYEGWYNENPQRAWDFLNDSPDAHFDDKYKTAYHPTFSTQSKYSGKKDATYNPLGLVGGIWDKQGTVFTMPPDGYRDPVSMDERKWYLENAEDNGVQLREANGSLPVFDGIPWGGVLPNVTIYGSKHFLGGPLVEAAMNEYKKGGGIHIAPSKKGTFTAAAKKHGKSVQAFASQVLAHPENYSPAMRKKANFARNARHWKHGLGGNLFDGESQPTQKMQVGLKATNDWKPYSLEDMLQFAEINKANKAAQEAAIARIENDYLTASNDATAVANGRPQNQHLAKRAVEGAKSHAAWEKEHPVATQWGNVLGAVPFAVAAYPLAVTAGSGAVALGDAAAATSAGQAITAGLAPLATAVSTNVAGAPLYSWADVGLSSLFGAHSAETAIAEGGVSPETALGLLPLTQVAKPAVKMGLQEIENVRYPLGRINEGAISKTFPTESNFNFWHGGLDSDFNFADLDVLRLASKQAKRGKDYAGFYMYDSSNQPGAFDYGMGEAHGIKIANNAKVFNANFNTERLSVNELMNYQNQGYDLIKGQNVFGEPEYILLNKDAIESSKFFDSNPGHTIHLSKRQLRRPKDKSSTIDWNHAKNTQTSSQSKDMIIESRATATPNIPYDEALEVAQKGRHQMKNLITSDDYVSRLQKAYEENGLHPNQAGFEIKQMEGATNDSELKVVPNLKDKNGEPLNGLYDPNTGEVFVAQDRDNVLDLIGTSQHEHAHATEIEKLLDVLKERWKHIQPRKEAYTINGIEDTDFKDYISSIKEMRAPAMAVWSQMKELGFKKVGDYLNHLRRFGMEDKQWENLVNRYGITNAKEMVETVFGLSPFMLLNTQNNEENSGNTMR